MTDPNYTPLCEASLDEIFHEIESRYDAVVLIYDQDKTTDASVFDYRFQGSLMRAIGMTNVTHSLMLGKFAPREDEPEN